MTASTVDGATAPPALTHKMSARRSKYDVPAAAESARVYDMRIAVDLPNHRKVKKLSALLEAAHPNINLGDKGFRCLIQLWTRAAKHFRLGAIDLSAEDVEFEAGWRDGFCPPEHHGLLVKCLLQAGFLDAPEGADAPAYQLHDWIVHQPWVTEGIRASAVGRFNKLVGLAKTRHGLTHAEALRFAHERTPEFAQLTGTTLEDQLDELSEQPEQLEMGGVGPSKAQMLGEPARPRRPRAQSASNARSADQGVDAAIAKVPIPAGIDPTTVRRFALQRAQLRRIKIEDVHGLVADLQAAADCGVDLEKLLDIMLKQGYTNIPLTVQLNRTHLVASSSTGMASMSTSKPAIAKPSASVVRGQPPRAVAAAVAASDDRINQMFRKVGVDLTNIDEAQRFFAENVGVGTSSFDPVGTTP